MLQMGPDIRSRRTRASTVTRKIPKRSGGQIQHAGRIRALGEGEGTPLHIQHLTAADTDLTWV